MRVIPLLVGAAAGALIQPGGLGQGESAILGAAVAHAAWMAYQYYDDQRELGREAMVHSARDRLRSEVSAQKLRP